MTHHDNRDPIDLLGGILAGTPSLPGAACVGSARLFDPAALGESTAGVAERHAIAVDICNTCPVLQTCRAWAASLPRYRRPAGVLAGRRPLAVGRPRRKGAA